MPWKVYVYVLNCSGYPMAGQYTEQELNSIVHTATQDIKKDYPDQHDAWEVDGSLEERYALNSLVHDMLPLYVFPWGKLKHDGIIAYDLEAPWYERIILTYWDETVEQYTVMVVMSDTESLVHDKEPL